MINTKFEAYKIKREITRCGQMFNAYRYQINEFGEPDNDLPTTLVGTFQGIYHEATGYVRIMVGETTQYRTKKQPMVLCLWDDIVHFNIVAGDIIIFNGKCFKIAKASNIQEWNIICDISLDEVVSDGK